MGKDAGPPARTVKSTLRFPRGNLKPEDFRRFIQLGSFQQDWERLGLDDEDLAALEILIMICPDKHPVVAGTGSLRKIRFGSSKWGTGKRSGVRVGYAHFPLSAVVVLLVAYDHSEKDDLSNQERTAIKQLLRSIGELLAQGA